MCIAADYGTDHAKHLGIVPDLVVGDLDSVSPEALAWAEGLGATIERHPGDKDETDLELALRRAVDHEPERIVVAAVGGGRLDHLLANFMVLADPRFAVAPIDILVDDTRVSVVHGQREITGDPGSVVSLLPIGEDAIGVTTSGLGYELHDEPLGARSSRGVSNYLVGSEATVALRQGVLLAVQPGHLDPEATS